MVLDVWLIAAPGAPRTPQQYQSTNLVFGVFFYFSNIIMYFSDV